MNKVDLIKKFGSNMKLAQKAGVSYRYLSYKIGYRLPESLALEVEANSDLEFQESDYISREVEYQGSTYKSQNDVNTLSNLKRAVKEREHLFFDIYGLMIPIEQVLENGEDAFLEAFRKYELFQKQQSPT